MVIYRVHVSLIGIEPPIWRSIELSSQTTLKQFHRILQIVMGWENYHLHEFILNGQRYGIPDPNYDEPGEVIAEGRVRLAEVLPAPGASIVYVYDLGDYWEHAVRLESAMPAQPDAEYPRVVGGARRCPPEDCGGSSGYANLMEILMDPTHEEYSAMREWAGDDFYAEEFPTTRITKRLRRNRSLAIKA